jgi:hypothetical protein
MKISRTQVYRVVEAKGNRRLIGKRCRILILDDVQDIQPLEGFLIGLSAFLLSGPQAGSTVELPPCKLKAVSRRVCHCHAYKFPHAPGFGACKQAEFEQEPPEEGMDLDALFTNLRST